MSQTIELESISRLDIKPGEILAVTLPAGWTAADAQRVHEQMTTVLPDVKIVVVSHGIDLQVLCPSSPVSPVDA